MRTLSFRLFWLGVFLLCGDVACRLGAAEPGGGEGPGTNATPTLKFERFQVGSKVYSNVTVTARTATDVFIRSREGFVNFKVEELAPPLLAKLGYSEEAEKKAAASVDTKTKIAEAATRALGGVEKSQQLIALVHQVKARVAGEGSPDGTNAASSGGPGLPMSLDQLRQALPESAMVAVTVVLVALPLIYFFFCYTARLVCQKAGTEPGFLIWVPLLSMIPLMRAAKLPVWLVILFLVPVVNLGVSILWSVKIAQARGKGILTAIALIFPPTWPFAWLYLAYSR